VRTLHAMVPSRWYGALALLLVGLLPALGLVTGTPGEVVLAAVAVILVGALTAVLVQPAPSPVGLPALGAAYDEQARPDRATDPVHHPRAPRAPGLG
jgi:sugar phosphate permease